MGIAVDLRVAARRWVASRRAPKPSGECRAERTQLQRWFEDVRAAVTAAGAGAVCVVDLEATTLPWTDTGLDLREGEWVSTFAAGRVVLSDALDLWVGPQFQLWMRVGETGAVFNGHSDSHSFRADAPGRLYLAGYFPGQWGDRDGRVSTSLNEYRSFRGGLSVAVIRWNGDAATALGALAEGPQGQGRFAAEASRLRNESRVPNHWNYLWFLGRADIFREAHDGNRACISCRTEKNAGILQHDVAFDLRPGTRLAWDWKVDELPSLWREDTALSHDYLSVAVEFENGRDITYTWSPELDVGTGYWCPLPTWKDREFHVVVRRGAADLGRWIHEERDLYADYRRYMGEPPRRVVRVWLIAVSLFQRRTGRALFADIGLHGADGSSARIS